MDRLLLKKRISFLLFILLFGHWASAQDYHTVRGQVINAADDKPVAMVTVVIPALNYWNITNESGAFEISKIPAGNYEFHFQLLGFQSEKMNVSVVTDRELSVKLHEQSLALDEVVVTATQSKLGSGYTVDNEAIQHLQPKSLADAFMLIPGNVTSNPTLANPQQIKIREISSNANSALGASVIIDGVELSNDADMHLYSTAQSGNSASTYGTTGKGIDLREISMEDVESVEVIRGIPSAEYGNITSGVVLVKTRSGETPWTGQLKTDPNTKIFSLYKGLKLSDRAGIVNLGGDYTQAYDDLREKYTGYKRITGKLAYSNTFLQQTTPLSLNINLNYFGTVDENKTDPQLKRNEKIQSSTNGFRAGINGKWFLKKNWITNLEYRLAANYRFNKGFNRTYMVLSSGIVPFPYSYEEGEYEVDYLPGIFYSEYTINNEPYSIAAKLKADYVKKIGALSNKLIVGVEWNKKGNTGRGMEYDISRPPYNNISRTIRPRAYKDIPVLNALVVYAEDKARYRLGETEFTFQAGVRLEHVNPGNYTRIDPRFNLSYQLFNEKNNSIFDSFTIHSGFGLTSKMPTLSYISPGNAYFDEASLNYYDPEHPLAIVDTKVIDTRNPDLKPEHSTKAELGFSFNVDAVNVSVTGFYDKMTDGFRYRSVPFMNAFRKFKIEDGGVNPDYVDGNVYYQLGGQRVEATTQMDTIIRTYNRPDNSQIIIKKGLEYNVRLRRIQALRTSFVVDGAWLYEEVFSDKMGYSSVFSTYQGKTFPYIAVFPGYNKTIKQRINTNIRTITHIPALNMVVSLTTQVIWALKERYRWDDKDGNSIVYYYGNDGKRVTGTDEVYRDRPEDRYVDPVAFVDKAGTVHPWKEEYATVYPYSAMVKTYGTSYYFKEERLPPAVQFNIHLTKEFSKKLEIAFMSNNFLNMRPSHKSNRTSTYVQRNTSFYFGVELHYKL